MPERMSVGAHVADERSKVRTSISGRRAIKGRTTVIAARLMARFDRLRPPIEVAFKHVAKPQQSKRICDGNPPTNGHELLEIKQPRPRGLGGLEIEIGAALSWGSRAVSTLSPVHLVNKIGYLADIHK